MRKKSAIEKLFGALISQGTESELMLSEPQIRATILFKLHKRGT